MIVLEIIMIQPITTAWNIESIPRIFHLGALKGKGAQSCNPRLSGSSPGAGNLKKLFIWMKFHGLPKNHNKDAWVR